MFLQLFHQCKNFLFANRQDREFLKALRKVLGYTPVHIHLYKVAFTHSSLGMRKKRVSIPVEHNERLEFLGDAVIGTIVSEYLYGKFPNQREGFLTQLRSKIVGREALSHLLRKLGLAKYIKAHLPRPLSKNILGNTLEALMGAVYLDKGYECARKVFVQRMLLAHVDVEKLAEHEIDFKSRLLELVQKQGRAAEFETLEEVKREKNGAMIFVSTLRVNNEVVGSGSGNSKKEAEQRAAEQAFLAMQEQ